MERNAATDLSVSVIIPAYNSEASLARSIESALAQTLAPHEIIVIDDGSSDGTADVARSYGDRIICLRQENQGQGAARNAGLRAATGRFVAFLDADDYWKPAFLGTCVEFLLDHDDAIAVSCGIIVRLWGKPERRWPLALEVNDEASPFRACVLDNFFEFWGEHNHVRTGSNVIRRETIERAGNQCANLRVSQDLEYWAYLATWGKWGFIPNHLWVGDPTPVAQRQGWFQKYRQRRRLCPTVEQWQARLLPRLQPEHMNGFRRMRGRVAAHFALCRIKGGATAEGWEIVREYGDEMPRNWSTQLMRAGLRTGAPGRLAAAMVLRARELYISVRMSLPGKRTQRKESVLAAVDSIRKERERAGALG